MCVCVRVRACVRVCVCVCGNGSETERDSARHTDIQKERQRAVNRKMHYFNRLFSDRNHFTMPPQSAHKRRSCKPPYNMRDRSIPI